jgi:hypothetical protein
MIAYYRKYLLASVYNVPVVAWAYSLLVGGYTPTLWI